MARALYLLTAFVVLSAWAGAQGPDQPAPLSAEDKLRLHRANGTLIDQLVRDGVEMSKPLAPDDQASRCRDASRSIVNAIIQAADAGEAERVAELTRLYREIVRDGLVPAIEEGQRTVPPQSPAARKLRETRATSANDVNELKAKLPAKLADNPAVKDALKQLDELAEALK